MHADDFLVNDGGDGHDVEDIGEELPEFEVVLTLALVVEAVDAVDGGGLVVAAEEEEVLGVLDLVGEEEADGLDGLLAAVHIVAQEEVVDVAGEAAELEQFEEV